MWRRFGSRILRWLADDHFVSAIRKQKKKDDNTQFDFVFSVPEPIPGNAALQIQSRSSHFKYSRNSHGAQRHVSMVILNPRS